MSSLRRLRRPTVRDRAPSFHQVVAPERDPLTGRVTSSRRRDKHRARSDVALDTTAVPSSVSSRRPRMWGALAALGVVGAGAVGVAVASGDTEPDDIASGRPVATDASGTAAIEPAGSGPPTPVTDAALPSAAVIISAAPTTAAPATTLAPTTTPLPPPIATYVGTLVDSVNGTEQREVIVDCTTGTCTLDGMWHLSENGEPIVLGPPAASYTVRPPWTPQCSPTLFLFGDVTVTVAFTPTSVSVSASSPPMDCGFAYKDESTSDYTGALTGGRFPIPG